MEINMKKQIKKADFILLINTKKGISSINGIIYCKTQFIKRIHCQMADEIDIINRFIFEDGFFIDLLTNNDLNSLAEEFNLELLPEPNLVEQSNEGNNLDKNEEFDNYGVNWKL